MAIKSEDRFKQAIVLTLAKRAANRCSNPDCGAITSGPSENPTASVNVGEAAHIYGAHVGSARYDPLMASTVRSDIANAIWLCGNCHKLIDDDENRYPAGLLFEWVKQHEGDVAQQVGKSGALARLKYERRHLEEFGKISYRAERLLIEKPDAWEYRLTEEVLRFEMAAVLQRWNALKRQLYMRPINLLSKLEFIPWILTRQAEVSQMAATFEALLNKEFSNAWGAPGEPGNEHEIFSTCRLYAEMCASALAWEETVRFADVRGSLKQVHRLYIGVAGGLIDEAAKLPAWMSETFGQGAVSGHYSLSLVLSLPDGWGEAVEKAFENATANFEYEDGY